MKDIKEFPLIAVTEIMDMPSVDNVKSKWDAHYVELGPTEEILDRKLRDVTGDHPWGKGDGYGWNPGEEIRDPIHIMTPKEAGREPYGHMLDNRYVGRKMMGNGHHRLAFEVLIQGALFVHYTEDYAVSYRDSAGQSY